MIIIRCWHVVSLFQSSLVRCSSSSWIILREKFNCINVQNLVAKSCCCCFILLTLTLVLFWLFFRSLFGENCRNGRRVSGNCKPASCYVRPKSTTQPHPGKNETGHVSTSCGKPAYVTKAVTRSSVRGGEPGCNNETRAASTAHTIQQQSQPRMNMILRSADRVSRYSTLRQ